MEIGGMTEGLTVGRKLQERSLYVGVAIIFVALLARNTGIYPVVFADEQNYSIFSRLRPLADSYFPSYLYLAIYRATTASGDGFLAFARLLNALFFVLAAPFIYLVARQTCTKGVASAVALLAMLGPINTYTAYYMPESLYFFSFWLLTWYLLQLDSNASVKAWSIAGILLGLSALVKPHSLLFLPAIVAYVLYVTRRRGDPWVLPAFRNAGVLVVFAFLTKLVISYLLAGEAGLTLFGPCYTNIANSAASQLPHYVNLCVLSAESVKGHALAICLLFGAPIAVAASASLSSAFSKAEIRAPEKISCYAIAVLLNLVLVVGVFTASVATAGPYESTARLHMRYYNFAFPLLLVIAASQLSLQSIAVPRGWRIITAIPIGLAITYAMWTRLASHTANLVDCPELRGFTSQSTVFWLLSGMSLIAVVLWAWSPRAGTRMFVYVFMPLTVVLSNVYANQDLRWRMAPDVFDRAGICTRQCLSKEDISKVIVVGSDDAGLYRALFHLDDPQASFQTIPAGAACDLAKLPAGKEWALIIGNHPLAGDVLLKFPMDGFTLARIRGTQNVGKEPADVENRAVCAALMPASETKVLDSNNLKHSQTVQTNLASPHFVEGSRSGG